MVIAFAMAELGSSSPTSGLRIPVEDDDAAHSVIGGVYYWTYQFSSPRYRNFLCWMVGYTNTLTYIAVMAGTGWAGATLITAAASIGSDFQFKPTVQQTL
jgi:amino acid transporter